MTSQQVPLETKSSSESVIIKSLNNGKSQMF